MILVPGIYTTKFQSRFYFCQDKRGQAFKCLPNIGIRIMQDYYEMCIWNEIKCGDEHVFILKKNAYSCYTYWYPWAHNLVIPSNQLCHNQWTNGKWWDLNSHFTLAVHLLAFRLSFLSTHEDNFWTYRKYS